MNLVAVLKNALSRSNRRPVIRHPDEADLRFFGQFVRSGSTVFDVGANNGDKSEVFLQLGAEVVAFEPQPRCATVLRKRFAGDSSFRLVNAGLADTAGELKMQICSTADTISTFSNEWKSGRFKDYTWDQELAVLVTTLDAAIAEYGSPEFIKVDVEGFESEVLAGLSVACGVLSFEFAKEFIDKAAACMRRLEEVGYREFNLALGECMQLELPHWTTSDELLRFVTRKSDPLMSGDIYARL